ncbi:MAG: IclR family transcriptional regulator [Ferrovibrio sp.]|nr:MAG: IclR family transcriptional regulator [Ferrovibrio sp.]
MGICVAKGSASNKNYAKIQSVARATEILKAFISADSWGPTELAQQVGLHKSVVHRLLVTLAGSGVLTRNAESGQYSLGPVIAQLQPRGGFNGALKQMARPYLQRLAAASGETVSLCVREESQGLCIDYVDSPQSMRFTVSTGQTFPLNAGCVGKVILAYQSEDFIEELIARKALKRYTPNTITDPKKLRAELLRIRKLGYAFSDSEITPGSRSVGAPIHGPDGAVFASLAISAPSFRMPDNELDRFTDMVRGEAAGLSRELGYVRERGKKVKKIAKEKV